MILIQTMCNKAGGKALFGELYWLSEQSGRLGVQQKLEKDCRTRAAAKTQSLLCEIMYIIVHLP